MTARILRHAWNLYKQNFGVIAAVILAICLPIDLLSSYMDYFVFDPDDIRKSFKFSRFLDNFIGIIAVAAIIWIGHAASIGERPSFGGAMRTGGSSWGLMWWTRFLTGLAIVFGFLLLLVPGIYLLVRLALIEPAVVCERSSGSAAMRRSFELTKGHFWKLFGLGLIFGAIMVAGIASVVVPALFIPALDHWLFDASTTLFTDFIGAYGTLCLYSAYVSLSSNMKMPLADSAQTGEPIPQLDTPLSTDESRLLNVNSNNPSTHES